MMLSNADMLRFSLSCWNVYNITNPLKEEKFMNTVLREEEFDVLEAVHEEYENMPHEKVVEGTRDLIEKHMEALTALANV